MGRSLSLAAPRAIHIPLTGVNITQRFIAFGTRSMQWSPLEAITIHFALTVQSNTRQSLMPVLERAVIRCASFSMLLGIPERLLYISSITHQLACLSLSLSLRPSLYRTA